MMFKGMENEKPSLTENAKDGHHPQPRPQPHIQEGHNDVEMSAFKEKVDGIDRNLARILGDLHSATSKV